jgi:hypothetical protein
MLSNGKKFPPICGQPPHTSYPLGKGRTPPPPKKNGKREGGRYRIYEIASRGGRRTDINSLLLLVLFLFFGILALFRLSFCFPLLSFRLRESVGRSGRRNKDEKEKKEGH